MTIPLILGTAEAFASVRVFLEDNGYKVQAITTRLGAEVPADFTRVRPSPNIGETLDALDALIRLFIRGEYMQEAVARNFVPATVLDSMFALGLLCRGGNDGQLYSPVAVCETHGVFTVCDRWSTPDNSPFTLPVDAVYPALTLTTQRFLDGISYRSCEALLDLCAGTGIAALAAAKAGARQAWATDITERCTHFAEFNRRINGLENVAVARGDLYEPVAGRTFDRIVAHPPYVPVLKPKWIYHDGGRDGEEITRRILEGLPQFLRPGGSLQMYAMGTDRDLPYEQRIRQWLGPQHGDFDILLIVRSQMEPQSFAAESALKNEGGRDFEQWKELLNGWGVKNMVYGSITVQRAAEENCQRPPLTLRRTSGPESRRAEADWLLRWEQMASSSQVYDWVLQSRPVVAENLQMAVTYRVQGGRFEPTGCKLAVMYPFNVEANIDSWMSVMLAECDGKRTGLELLQALKESGRVAADTPAEQFAILMCAFVARGFIVIEECAPPAMLKAAVATAAKQ